MSELNINPESAKRPDETERKFLITKLPDRLENFHHEHIRQGYLVIGADGSETRIRDKAGKYTYTEKTKGTLTRGEIETSITKEHFNALWPATEGKRIEKTRYDIPHGGVTIELDIFEGALAGLATAEIEFPDEQSADDFALPEWLGQEVTYDNAYKNQQLALNGLPSGGIDVIAQ